MESSREEVGELMQEVTWEVGSVGSGVPVQTGKVEYVPIMRNNPKSTAAEKESVRIWNLMVTTLRDNGLMKEKDN